MAGTAVVRARSLVRGYSAANCEVAARTAERVGLGPGVAAGLLDVYEQWDGKGGPRGLRGEAIAAPARIAQVAATAALFHGTGGADAAVDAVRRRAGAVLDPGLVDTLRRSDGARPPRVARLVDLPMRGRGGAAILVARPQTSHEEIAHAAEGVVRRFVDEYQIAEGDKVVTRKVFTGTHEGRFQGLEPTGRAVEIHVIDIVRVADGRIVEHWNCVDRLGLLAQLGAVPEMAAD